MNEAGAGDRKTRIRGLKAAKWGLAVLLLGLVGSEIVLRLAVGLGRPVLYVVDPACGYLPKPNQKVHRFGHEIDINTQGMRSTALPATKPANDLRLLFVGDSVTFGTTRVDQNQIFSSLVEAKLSDALHRPIETLNASAGGWAVGNEAGYLQSRGLFDADVVLIVLNTGDLVQPFNQLKPEDALNYPQHAPLSAIGELCERYIGPRLFHTGGPASDSGSVAATASNAVNELPPVLASLDGVRQQVQTAGAKFVVVFIPAVAPDWQQLGYAAAFDKLKQWTADHSVTLWDLTPDMTARPINELYQDGIHPNATGHAIIADRLTREIIASKP